MKKTFSLLFTVVIACITSSCFEDNRVIWQGAVLEFDQAVTLTPAVGVNYPIITTTRGATIRARINLVGAQRPNDEVITVAVDPVSTGREGVHFTMRNGGRVTIPANSSFGFLEVDVLNPPPAPGTSVIFVFNIQGNENLKPSENYRRLGFRLNL
ncbi:MAG: DUF4843 domain-containing protein [Cytophagales bacterium]|nr:DUF4843 domain-containing protein [Bernardetiaceae bacterium]MDW8209818.1 DUF4843 domain-containing protein [Cytophagales bacterium]